MRLSIFFTPVIYQRGYRPKKEKFKGIGTLVKQGTPFGYPSCYKQESYLLELKRVPQELFRATEGDIWEYITLHIPFEELNNIERVLLHSHTGQRIFKPFGRHKYEHLN